jgi:RNA polymerase sigma factor (sigma-70 family)
MTDIDQHEAIGERMLVGLAESGQNAAFDELYRRHAPSAWRLSLAVTRDVHDAADVMADGFAKVFTAIRAGRYSPDAPFRPYLLTTVRNTAVDLMRSRRHEAPGTHGAVTERIVDIRSGVDPVATLEADETACLVSDAFAKLPERWRSVLWLSEVEDMKPRDIAPIVGLSPNATAQLAVRARRGLREQYLQEHVASTGDRNCSRAVARMGAYVDGGLEAEDAEKVQRHLRLCSACTERHAQLSHIAEQVPRLALPLPVFLMDAVRSAWTAAVVTPIPAPGSGTGLSATTEKVLAGVSALAAAFGVVGAALVGTSGTDSIREEARIAPIVTDAIATPDPFVPPRRGGVPITGVVVPAGASTSDPAGVEADLGDAPDGDTDRAPGSGSAPDGTGSDGTGTDGAGSGPGNGTDPHVETGSTNLTISTSIAGQPLTVEVSEDPGITVGPVTVGEPDSDTDTVSTDGDADSLDPLTDAVNDTLTGTL